MFFIEDDKDTFILQSQYHGYWWPGDARIWVISSLDLNLVVPEYSSQEG